VPGGCVRVRRPRGKSRARVLDDGAVAATVVRLRARRKATVDQAAAAAASAAKISRVTPKR